MSRISDLAGFTTSLSSTQDLSVGVITATSFVGDGSNLTGVANTDFIVGTSITMTSGTFTGNVSIAGTLTYEDVTNVDSIGIITARNGIDVLAGGISAVGVITATSFVGDGSQLDGVVSGVEILDNDSSVATSVTAINFSGATISGGSGFSTITIATAGLTTEAETPNNTIVYLDLSVDEHKLTVSGITTISATGGTEGGSHIVRIINSGIATVGFSTYFLWPSGSPPSLPTADGAISLLSISVNRVGAAGTQLLTTVAQNFS